MVCVVCLLLGQFPYGSFEVARAAQLPLTVSGGVGSLLGIGLCLLASRAFRVQTLLKETFVMAASMGLCLSLLLRCGYLAGSGNVALVAGDVLAALFLTVCAFVWWLTLCERGHHTLMSILAKAMVLAATLYCCLALLPANVARLLLCLAFPLALCLCQILTVSKSRKDDNASDTETVAESLKTEATGRLSSTVILTIVLCAFTVNLPMALFPVSLYHEASPLLAGLVGADPKTNAPFGTLTEPAFLCVLAVVIAGGVFLALGRKRDVPLASLYYVGLAMTAFDYLAFPYHFEGGLPLAIAEAGRFVVAFFLLASAARLVDNNRETAASSFVKVCGVAFAAMLAADIVALVVQLLPGFDYMDFRVRTIFAGVGTAVLIILLLGPLPRVSAAISPVQHENSEESKEALSLSLEERFEQICASFAADHGLSAREAEVFKLIANGRDVPYIEKELVLAKSTVKTHIKHIYEKCNVSSRQDLIDLLEEYKG